MSRQALFDLFPTDSGTVARSQQDGDERESVGNKSKTRWPLPRPGWWPS